MEVNNMKDFNKVAIVNLFDDYACDDYAVALYDDEAKLICDSWLVVVNGWGNENARVLGEIKRVFPIEDCDKEILGQVIGVVNMDAYNKRHIEEKRLKETAEKKATIEKELEQEINKYKTVTYYEDMAKKYPNNSRLQDFVNKLLELGE